MRVTVAIFAIVGALILGRFVWDDVVSGEDIPRGVTVDGVAIGNLDRDEAEQRLRSSVTADRVVELTWGDGSTSLPLSDWGITIDAEATLDAAEDLRGGGPLRFLRWTAAIVRDRTVDPVWLIDGLTLADHVRNDTTDVAVIDAAIELGADGRFVPTVAPPVPIVDMTALQAAVLEAADDSTITAIAVPIGGFEAVEEATELAEAANDLTDRGLQVILAGQLLTHDLPSSTMREWLVAGAADTIDDVSFDPDLVVETLRELYPVGSIPTTEEGVEFVIGFDGEVYIVGALEDNECCAADTADNLLARLRADVDETITVFPAEAPGAEGLAWAESLGITELVGEFTTFYAPSQTRNINIARISEITRGAVIEPGETLSVNDYVGRRTAEDGFVSAGVISNGVFSSSVGGGISQYATTLFNAAFFAGLDFGEYQSHSIYIGRYPYGREATVSFPAPDLQIVNTSPYGVLLWPTTNADSITVRLYSTKWASGEQSGQTERSEGSSCTRVTTERTRTWVDDGHTEIDTVTARYRPEGINCDGSSTRPTTTTTLAPATTPTTTLAPDPTTTTTTTPAPDPTTTTTTTPAPDPTTTTTLAPDPTTTTTTTTTTTLE
jgi:hypothetical protein